MPAKAPPPKTMICLPPAELQHVVPDPKPDGAKTSRLETCHGCGTSFEIKAGAWNVSHMEADCPKCQHRNKETADRQRAEKLQHSIQEMWHCLGQPFDAYRRKMAPFTTLEALEKTLRFHDSENRQALFEAMQLAAIGTVPLQMTPQQRHAFDAAIRFIRSFSLV